MSTINRVIVLGDSYTFGHGCSDREFYYDEDTNTFIGDETPFMQNIPSSYCWASLLQHQFNNIEVINLGIPANCSQGIFRNLIEYHSEHPLSADDIVIFNGTFPSRIEVALGDKPEVVVPWVMGWDHHSQMENEIPYNMAKKMYITHLFNDDIGCNLSMTALLATYGFATVNNLKFIWSLPTQSYNTPFLKKLLCIGKFQIPHISKYDFSKNHNYDFNKTCYAPDHHVNDKGHLIYFEREIIPLIQRLL
jgi:hypothetical protein